MYRNIFYNSRTKSVRLWTWDDKGNRIQRDFPFKPYLYVESNNHKDATSIFDTPLRKITFNTQYDRFKYAKDSGIQRLFYDIPVDQQFLIEQFSVLNTDPSFSDNPLKKVYIDIETYSPDEFPEPEYAKDPINVITIYDSLEDKFFTWGLDHSYKNNNPKVVYHKCNSETELLREFIKYWSSDYPDIVSGWHIDGFDIPYIVNRITNILGENAVKKLSPVDSVRSRMAKTDFGKDVVRWSIDGVSIIDYLNAYKTFSMSEKASYKLDDVAEDELGTKKVEFLESSLAELADNDWQTFIDYNIQDVNIIVELEEKLQYLQLVRMLGYMGLSKFEAALGTVGIVTGAIALKALEHDKIIPTFKTQARKYPGGFVKEPDPGLREHVMSFDANSLYPNTIITLNLSPETKLGKVISSINDKYEIQLVNGKTHMLNKLEFAKFIKAKNIAISKAKVMFSQEKKGICPEILEGIYSTRVENQKKLDEHEKAIAHCKKGTANYIKHRDAIVKYDTMQYTLKILMNRIYGAFATPYFSMCDVDLASSITLTGQACVKQAGDIIDRYAKATYGVEEDCLVYNDTDSAYITVDPIIKKLDMRFLNNRNRVSKEVYDLADGIQDNLNDEINIWSKKVLNSNDSRFFFKRETICNSGIFIKKKRYILHVLDDKGPCDKIKPIGVELVSSSTPKSVKPLIKHVVEVLMKTKDQKETNNALKDAYEKFKELAVEELAITKSLKNYDKWANKCKGFEFISKTPWHVKASICHNRLLEMNNLTKKYQKLKSGDKVKLFYVQPNKYNVELMAFSGKCPTEFEGMGILPDVDKMFEKAVFGMVQRIYNAVDWPCRNPSTEYACDLFELLG
jgi:DNA polymerase elongation subunit (family B)